MEELYEVFGFSVGVALGIFIMVLIIVTLICYVFSSLGLQKMAKKIGIENDWLAWIPIGNIYLMGKIAGDQVTIFSQKITNLSTVLVVGYLLLIFVEMLEISVLIFIVAIAYLIVSIGLIYKIFRIFVEDSAVLYTVLSAITLLQPFFIFAASLKEPNIAIYNEGTEFDIVEETEIEVEKADSEDLNKEE